MSDKLTKRQVIVGMIVGGMIGILLAAWVAADQTQIPRYSKARDLIYQELYPNGGFTLYCGEEWTERNSSLNVEHVYPASWAAKALGCSSREDCRRNSTHFNHIEADLHNLWVTRADANQRRSNHPLGLVNDAQPLAPGCESLFDSGLDVMEPRPISRGNAARSILYMITEYTLPAPPNIEVLLLWHLHDPVSPHERRRNDAIEEIQGTRNPWID